MNEYDIEQYISILNFMRINADLFNKRDWVNLNSKFYMEYFRWDYAEKVFKYFYSTDKLIEMIIRDLGEVKDLMDLYNFFGYGEITSLNIPNNVTNIEKNAFQYWSFENINIPNSVTNIGENAFLSCENLKEIIIPNSVTNIGNSAFANCSNLESLTISGKPNLGSGVFYGCDNLKNINAPNNIKQIILKQLKGEIL